MGGTAASAGLVTRGITGVSAPDANGVCNKENLYVNYDGDNTYRDGRHLILQAGATGTHYGSNLYQYAAARGDAVKGWVESQGYLKSLPSHTHSEYAAASHSHDSITYQDTRGVNQTPDQLSSGVSVHLKSNGTDGISDGGNYHPVLALKPWGDISGGPYAQIAPTQNGNLFWRVSTNGSTWGSWQQAATKAWTLDQIPTKVSGLENDAGYATYDWVNNKGYITSSGNANTATMPLGFSSRNTGATWGNQTGTSFTCWNDPSGGSVDWRQDNPVAGKVSMKVDGRVYVNEGNNPVMAAENANGFWGMCSPDGENNVWVRTTTQGLIPYQSGAAGSGHQSLGTSTWYFSAAYIDNVYGTNFHGLAAKATADASGNNIASTYLPKSGGTMTGNIAVSLAGNPYLQLTEKNTGTNAYAQVYDGGAGVRAAFGFGFANSLQMDQNGNMSLPGGIELSSSSAWIKPYLLAFKNADTGASPTYPYTGFYQWGNEWQVNARDSNNNWAKNVMAINLVSGVANFIARPTVNGAGIALLDDIPETPTLTVNGALLYNNASGTTGTITLSNSAANYSFLEIQYTDGSRYMTQRVYSPNGKRTILERSVYGDGFLYENSTVLYINGTSITRDASLTGRAYCQNGGPNNVDTNNSLYVTSVVGWH